MGKYDNIINLNHHVSKKHPQMTIQQRAAQFAPFAALTGYEEQVSETARITERRIEIDDEIKKELDIKLAILKSKINEKPEVTITYFIPDSFKSGGKYETITKRIKRIDDIHYKIVFTDNSSVHTKEINNIEINIKK